MRITICGSIAFLQEMLDAKKVLEARGHKVDVPSFHAKDPNGDPISMEEFYRIRKSGKMDATWFESEKSRAIREHFEMIAASDAILVMNEEKNGVAGYVGGNTLMEMGVAFHLKKSIYLLYAIPQMGYTEEIMGMSPIVLGGDLARLA